MRIVYISVSQTFSDCVPPICFLLHCVPTGSGINDFTRIYKYLLSITPIHKKQHNLMRLMQLFLLHKLVYSGHGRTNSASEIMSRLS